MARAHSTAFLHLTAHFVGLDDVAGEAVGVGRATAAAVVARPALLAGGLAEHVGLGKALLDDRVEGGSLVDVAHLKAPSNT